MDTAPQLPPELLAGLPPAVSAFIRWQAERIRVLETRVAELEARLGLNPTNSSKPPSTTHPHAKPKRPAGGSRNAVGGQPGHPKHERPLLPPEDCQQVIPCVPTACRRCGTPLTGIDLHPLRHQVWELPEIKPLVTEYQQHRLVCGCGCSTCGPLPAGVPTGQAGPRLIAFAALLMASFRQSKRRAAYFLGTIFNQPASAGWLVLLQNRAAAAVEPAYLALLEQLPDQAVQAIDESPTTEGTAKAWVWTFVAATFTAFVCRTSRGADVLRAVLGDDFTGVIHCDRAKMYWAFGRLQWCWAHLKRDFQRLIDSPCTVKKRLGHDLMRSTKELFELWHKMRDQTLSRAEWHQRMGPLREQVESLLLRGEYNRKTRGFCKELYTYRTRLWTFVDVEGVEPTNNAAERALRHAVIWRKLSFGTKSASGSRFVERLLTVIETCRRQQRNAFTWLTEAVQAHLNGRPTPSLVGEV